MIGPLYDDFYHVQGACAKIQATWGDRPLVFGLNCLMGESLWASRVAALLFGLLSCWVYGEILGLKKSLRLTLMLHPVVLFPFFYPSQLSTAMMCCWIVCVLLWSLRPARGLLQWGLLPILAGVGSGIRIESGILLVATAIPVFFLRSLQQERVTNQTRVRSFGKILAVVGLSFAIYPFFRDGFLNSANSASVFQTLGKRAASAASYYDPWDYRWAQLYAAFLYVQNLFFPALTSFFGPWKDFFSITLKWEWRIVFSLVIGILSGLSAITSQASSQPPSQGKFPSMNRRVLALAFLSFVALSLGSSLHLSVDWYYPSRQVLATLLTLGMLCRVIQGFESQRWIRIINLYLALSLAFTYFFHYRNEESFLAFELSHGGESHPQVHTQAGNLLAKNSEFEEAVGHYQKAARLASPEARAKSLVAVNYWSIALLNQYLIADQAQNQLLREDAVRELDVEDNFFSALVCLYEKRGEPSCLKGDRKEKRSILSIGEDLGLKPRPFANKTIRRRNRVTRDTSA
jgi:tetratricopeptide (TPR) repeat protein